MYNPHGDYVKKVPLVELTIRTGYLGVDNNLDYLTQGAFRQPSAKVGDSLVDPDVSFTVFHYKEKYVILLFVFL